MGVEVVGNALNTLAIALAALGIGGGALAFVILSLMNMWGILDPRMGATVKSGLLRVCISLVLLGIGAGIPGIARAIAGGGAGA